MAKTKRATKVVHEGTHPQRPKPSIMALANAVEVAEGFAQAGDTDLATPRIIYCERAGGWRNLTAHELAEVKRYREREAQRRAFRERQAEAADQEFLRQERAAAQRAREARQQEAQRQQQQRQSTKPWLAIVKASEPAEDTSWLADLFGPHFGNV